MSSAESLLGAARARIERWTPAEALALVRDGALLVDIRPESQRRTHGQLPFGVVVERNVLEWRLDPNGEWRIPEATGFDRVVVLLCQEGFASSLAAAALVDLGYRRAGDVIGGLAAWRSESLPIQRWLAPRARLHALG